MYVYLSPYCVVLALFDGLRAHQKIPLNCISEINLKSPLNYTSEIHQKSPSNCTSTHEPLIRQRDMFIRA